MASMNLKFRKNWKNSIQTKRPNSMFMQIMLNVHPKDSFSLIVSTI